MALNLYDTLDPQGNFPAAYARHIALDDGALLEDAFRELRERINAVLDSDDATLDELSEIVAYIKSNKTLIDAITTSKIGFSDIVNDLATNAADKPLSAAQGVVLAQQLQTVAQEAVPPILAGAANIEPERYYAFGEVDSLAITLAEKADGRAHLYQFEFVPTEAFSGLTITPEPVWCNDAQYPVGKRVLVAVQMGMAVMGIA